MSSFQFDTAYWWSCSIKELSILREKAFKCARCGGTQGKIHTEMATQIRIIMQKKGWRDSTASF